jgi:adenylate cyclase
MVLVADIRRFSELSQEYSSTEVYAVIKEIFNTFSKIVVEFRGTIKDYAGDAVYAFWDHHGSSAESQALLACQAAMKQQQLLDDILVQLSARYSSAADLQMGWGITTGKVTMSHYGEHMADLALVGDCINLAFRFSAIANKQLSDEIVICAQTAMLVRNELAVKDLGMIPVRGRKGKEHVFALKQGIYSLPDAGR